MLAVSRLWFLGLWGCQSGLRGLGFRVFGLDFRVGCLLCRACAKRYAGLCRKFQGSKQGRGWFVGCRKRRI